MMITVLGAIFKILHLNGADEIILLGHLTLFIAYFIHFLGKKPKIRLDYLKVMVVASTPTDEHCCVINDRHIYL
jgi:hypothetical protein